MEPVVAGAGAVTVRTVELGGLLKWGYVLWSVSIYELMMVLALSVTFGLTPAVASVAGLAAVVAGAGAVVQVRELRRLGLPGKVFWALWSRTAVSSLRGSGLMGAGAVGLGPFLVGALRMADVSRGELWPIPLVFGAAAAVALVMIVRGALLFVNSRVVARPAPKGWDVRGA